MPLFATTWPWIALGAAGILLILLAVGDALQTDRRVPRFQDMTWLTWLGVAAYLLHQFEEHGVDLLGHPYAFRGSMCAALSFRDAVSCPVPLSFITAMNVGSVWGAGLISVLMAPRRPLIGLSFFALPLVDLVAQVGGAITDQRYAAGLLTALLLFLPLCLWVLVVAVRRYGAGVRAVLIVPLAGIVVHAVLLGSLWAYLNFWFGDAVLAAIQVLNALVPAGLMLLVTRPRAVAQPTPAPAPTPKRRRTPKTAGQT
ncbi:HXXEE domain-containing protein [Aquabacter sp. CN5-332]|uniref:HXXEE domain-containing protein n=1 Tax=Aquabacter sp. CN5-332 TaxID=3156608 RepID=UPI0032B3CA62